MIKFISILILLLVDFAICYLIIVFGASTYQNIFGETYFTKILTNLDILNIFKIYLVLYFVRAFAFRLYLPSK